MPIQDLTPRELQVLELVAKSYDNEQIAALLAISGNTVHTHVASILSKLGVHDRREATRVYLDQYG